MDKAGKNKSGVIEGDNARQVRQQIREQGLIPLELEQVEAKQQKSSKGFSLFKPRISAAELALITRQLATLIESALPIEESLLAVAEQTEKATSKNMLMAVRSKVVEGHTLADSLGEFSNAFDTLFCAMVAAGEKSGHLDTVLNRLADYTEKREHTKNQITKALVYPFVMLFFAIGIVTTLLTVVVPKIVGQFDQMGQELPFITHLLISMSAWTRENGVYLAIAVVILIVGIRQLLLKPRIRKQYHRYLLNMPLIGKLARGINTARFARTLSILSASAVPLLESMRIAGDVLENLHIKEMVAQAAVNVREGSSLRAALGETKIFPPMMMHMIASGEKSGELQEMLERSADNQDREFESLVGISLTILEPLMIVFMAGIVLFIVMAILLPIITLNSSVSL
jgi:general secretion pathway protein F